jgi:outer membrane protein assembly factor BamB
VLIIPTGGENLLHDGVAGSYGKLFALQACTNSEAGRVRWITNDDDLPNKSGGEFSLGAATVTGGIVFIGTDQGHLIVLADPTVVPSAGLQCSNNDYANPTDCAIAGFNPNTPIPKMLANISIPDGGDLAKFRKEAVLAKGRVFVATDRGHVYMLEPTAVPGR